MNETYFISVSHGSAGRYETSSQVFKLHRNETVELIQNITTKGASGVSLFTSNAQVYLLIANEKDNSGSTNLQSQVNNCELVLKIIVKVKCRGGKSIGTWEPSSQKTFGWRY